MSGLARPWSEWPRDRPPRGVVQLSRADMSALGVGAGAVLSGFSGRDAGRAIGQRNAAELRLPPEALDRIAAATHGRVGADIAAVRQRLGLSAVRRAAAGDRALASDTEFDEAVAALAARPEGI